VLAAVDAAAWSFAEEHREAVRLPDGAAVAVWENRSLAPVPRPGALRDFYALEGHVATANAKRGREVPRAWYEVPVFSFGHAGTIVGPEEAVRKPTETQELDFELELACVIGKAGRDIPATAAWAHVAGLTVLNDWSARDVQRQEMSVGLGPAKGKDFATSLGPAIVTLDEVADRFDGERHDLAMGARIDGEEVARGNANTIYWTFPRMIERASRDVWLEAGDVIGSGTVGGGCLLELGPAVHPWLQPGDEVESEIERLGRLRNAVV
jgi:fumarylacetoacetate (FAA) hydrolase